MDKLNIKNDAKSWEEFLVSIADEAARDAADLPPDLAMHGILTDLSLVARSYAERVAHERGADVRQPVETVQAAVAPKPEAPLGAEATQETPGWLLDTLADMHNRLGAQAARIEALEDRVSELERNQQLNVVTPSAYLIESENDDINPAAWDNIDRARAALRGMVARAHRERSAIRQQILARVTSLAKSPDRDSQINAEIEQHSQRAEELGRIDAIAGRKMDEIAALDDLDEARFYVDEVRKGWPE